MSFLQQKFGWRSIGIFGAGVTLSLQILYGGLVQAQPAGYGFGKIITIQSSQVSGTGSLTNFPIVINLSDNDLRTTGNGGNVENANGYDIVFTEADCSTILDHEIESYNAASGAYVAWVRMPSLSGTVDTEIGMFYGNSSIATNPSTTNTWNSDYVAVYHLHNDFLDGTANNLDATNNGSSDVGGQMGDGQDFDGTNDYIQTPSGELQTENNFTISAWFNSDDVTRRHILWQGIGTQNGWGSGGNNNEQEMHLSMASCCMASETSNLISSFLGNNDDDAETDVITAQTAFSDVTNWHYGVATFADLAGTPLGELFLDGASVASDAGVADPSTARNNWDTNFRIGRPGANTRYFDGSIDEVRISKVVRSDDWITTEYNNQSDPSSFYTVSTQSTALATCNLLPIELLGFQATVINNQQVRLDWATASEVDNDFFTIERSKDLEVWEVVGKVEGAGFSTETIEYSYWDRKPYHGKSYYFLRQTDFNGTSTTSEIRPVTIASWQGEIFIHPNPANDLITINLPEDEQFKVAIHNSLGQQLQIPIKLNDDGIQVDTHQLETGVYFIQVVGKQLTVVEKIFIKR